MTVRLVIPGDAVEAGRNAALRQQSTKAAIEAAAPLIVAAYLEEKLRKFGYGTDNPSDPYGAWYELTSDIERLRGGSR